MHPALYEWMETPPPQSVQAYLTGGRLPLVASLQGVPLLELCKVEMFGSVHTYTRYSTLVQASSVDTFFDTVILQSVA